MNILKIMNTAFSVRKLAANKKHIQFLFSHLFLIVLLTICSSCKKCDCPAWDESYTPWIPYQAGEIPRFSNQSVDTAVLTVPGMLASESYQIDAKFENGCESYLKIDREYGNLMASIIKYYDCFEIRYRMSMETNNEFIGGDFVHVSKDLDLEKDTACVLGQIYENVIKVEFDTTAQHRPYNRIWKIVLAKGHGLVALYDTESSNIWTRVE